jgi:signal transduction histidine kinase
VGAGRGRRVLPLRYTRCRFRVDAGDPPVIYRFGVEQSPGPPWPRRAGYEPGRRRSAPGFALAAVTGLIQVIASTGAAHSQPNARPLDLLGYLLLLAGPLALAFRRRVPELALAVALAVTVAYFLLGYPEGPAFLAALFALFAAIRTGLRWLVWALAGAAYACYVGLGSFVADLPGDPSLGRSVTVGAWLLVVLAFAEGIRVRTAHFAEMARTRAETARARAEQEKREASEERLRIARELHDVLGHHLSLISVQAGVGLHLMDSDPEQARTALTAIKQASAEALREVRSVLGALRPEDESAPRTPAPGLADLSQLVSDVNAAGLAVRTVTDGESRPLPAEVDRAALRVVQEALTNVRRHAGPDAEAQVTVAYGGDDVVLRVRDNGDGGLVDGTGTGIPGMRERVTALGGDFSAGPADGGGFEVYARLPTPGGDP